MQGDEEFLHDAQRHHFAHATATTGSRKTGPPAFSFQLCEDTQNPFQAPTHGRCRVVVGPGLHGLLQSALALGRTAVSLRHEIRGGQSRGRVLADHPEQDIDPLLRAFRLDDGSVALERPLDDAHGLARLDGVGAIG